MKKILVFTVIALTLVGVIFASVGCSGVKVSDILENPSNYEGKEVSVSGTVTDRYWIDLLGLKAGAYQIDDGSGEIWIITKQEPPAKGGKASSKGTVSSAGKIGDRSFGTVINEAAEK